MLASGLQALASVPCRNDGYILQSVAGSGRSTLGKGLKNCLINNKKFTHAVPIRLAPGAERWSYSAASSS